MNKDEKKEERSRRILSGLSNNYPDCKSYDLDGRGEHFVCEVDPVDKHPEYDRAVEVVISSKPHKHKKMVQYYSVMSGTLELHIEDNIIYLNEGDKYTIKPGNIHWAKSDNECWVEIYSEPGWTKEDHITVK